MEFIVLRLIQLSKRELGVLNELYYNILQEKSKWLSKSVRLLEKERILIHELIQIERDKQEEYTVLSRKMDCHEHSTDERVMLKKMLESNLTRQNRLLHKLVHELLVVVKKISAKNTCVQIIVDEFLSREVETVTFDQILPYLSSVTPSENSHLPEQTSISSVHSN